MLHFKGVFVRVVGFVSEKRSFSFFNMKETRTFGMTALIAGNSVKSWPDLDEI